MKQNIDNSLGNCKMNDYIGGNQTNNYYSSMIEEKEREFVVTRNANIKPVSYFTGRETELKDLRQRIEEGRKSVLVSGMGGIGKTHICRKLFEEYLNKHAEDKDGPFEHIGYIEYSDNMDSCLQHCLKYEKQGQIEDNKEAAWRELEYLASDGKLLLFIDNVNVTIGEDSGLSRLKGIPGAIVLTSRRTSFSKEFEPYRIGFLSTEQCRKIYERIRYGDTGKKVSVEEVPDLEYIINSLAAGHTITIEFLAHLAETKHWDVIILRKELESKGFLLEYKDEEDKLINIQESYEKLYDLSELTVAEQNILEAFSVFPYISLETEICNQWLLADAGVSKDDDILTGLYRKGWLQFDLEQDSYALHPVFAQFIFEKCKPKIEKHFELIDACRQRLEISIEEAIDRKYHYLLFAANILKKMNLQKDKRMIALRSTFFNVGEQLKKNYRMETREKKERIRIVDTRTKFVSIQTRKYGEEIRRIDENIIACKERTRLAKNQIRVVEGLMEVLKKINLEKLNIEVCEEFIFLNEIMDINELENKACEEIIGLLETVDMENLDNRDYEKFIDLLKKYR